MTNAIRSCLTGQWKIGHEYPISWAITRTDLLYELRAVMPSGRTEIWWSGEDHGMALVAAEQFQNDNGWPVMPINDRVLA